MDSIELTPPLVVGDITLVRWIEGHTYETSTGATIYSGAEEPSQADAEECIQNPRTLPIPTPVRELSKLDLKARLDLLGKWAAFKAALEALGAWDDFVLAAGIRTDHPLFVEHAPTLKATLQLTDAEFASLIA